LEDIGVEPQRCGLRVKAKLLQRAQARADSLGIFEIQLQPDDSVLCSLLPMYLQAPQQHFKAEIAVDVRRMAEHSLASLTFSFHQRRL
jgi:hypothetical protein